ncbi:hypothetical protein J4219_06685 [Candidatus Woesearchaeota archaeon]|nr:hypothetical protein [Candidatus Woesearchaeota archaeon]
MNEKNAFLDVLGYNPQAKILDVLITGRRLEYSATGIIRAAEIGRATFYKIFPHVLKQSLILSTKKIGNIQLYTINQKNPTVQQLIKLHCQIIKGIIEQHKFTEIETPEAEIVIA